MEFLSFFKHVDAMFNTFSFTLVLLLQLSFYVLSCNAQATQFVWGFGDNVFNPSSLLPSYPNIIAVRLHVPIRMPNSSPCRDVFTQ